MSSADFRALVLAQQRRVDRLVALRGVKPIRGLYTEIVESLVVAAAASPAGSFTRTVQEGLLGQARAAMVRFVGEGADALSQASAAAVAEAASSSVQMVAKMEKVHRGAVVPLPIDEIAIVRNVTARAPSLLRTHRTSLARYGGHVIGEIEKAIALGQSIGEDPHKIIDRVVAAAEVDWYQAERIVRTEMSYASCWAQRDAIEETDRDTGDTTWAQWSEHADEDGAPLDERVAVDSLAMHGQVAPPGGSFTMPPTSPHPDAKGNTTVPAKLVGKTWANPPNRPNDRSVIVPWRPDWGTPGWVWRGGKRVDAREVAESAAEVRTKPKPDPEPEPKPDPEPEPKPKPDPEPAAAPKPAAETKDQIMARLDAEADARERAYADADRQRADAQEAARTARIASADAEHADAIRADLIALENLERRKARNAAAGAASIDASRAASAARRARTAEALDLTEQARLALDASVEAAAAERAARRAVDATVARVAQAEILAAEARMADVDRESEARRRAAADVRANASSAAIEKLRAERARSLAVRRAIRDGTATADDVAWLTARNAAAAAASADTAKPAPTTPAEVAEAAQEAALAAAVERERLEMEAAVAAAARDSAREVFEEVEAYSSEMIENADRMPFAASESKATLATARSRMKEAADEADLLRFKSAEATERSRAAARAAKDAASALTAEDIAAAKKKPAAKPEIDPVKADAENLAAVDAMTASQDVQGLHIQFGVSRSIDADDVENFETRLAETIHGYGPPGSQPKPPTLNELSHAWAPPKGYTAKITNVSTSSRGAEVEIDYYDSNGDVAATLTRSFWKGGEIHHSYLTIKPEHQSVGFADTLNGQAFLRYERWGIRKVTIDAAWVGRYAWARMGCNFSTTPGYGGQTTLDRMIEVGERFIDKRVPVEKREAYKAKFRELAKEPWKLAKWAEADGTQHEVTFDPGPDSKGDQTSSFPIGKAILLDGDTPMWSASMDIDRNNPGYLNAMRIMKVGQRK